MQTNSGICARIVVGIMCCALNWGCAHQLWPTPAPAGQGAVAPTAIEGQRVGFDLDDTLLFSSPAFDKATAAGADRDSPQYWEIVNSSDGELSVVKSTALAILRTHQQQGDIVYIVTARHPHGIDPLLDLIEEEFLIPPDRVFFETDGKANRLKSLGIAVFYGDSDSDIKAAQEAGAHAIRILRSPESTYRWSYHPGEFGEEIVDGSEN